MNQKNLNILFGVALTFLLYKQFKRCACCRKKRKEIEDSVAEPNSSNENSDEMSCEEAVKEILNERTKTMKLSAQGYKKMYDEELEKCKKA